MKFGFSISAHYRLLNNTENVSKLVVGLCGISSKLKSLELSYYDFTSMDMYTEGYKMARKSIDLNAMSDVSIHFLRTGVTKDNFPAIVLQVQEIAILFGVKDIIIHDEMYDEFKDLFAKHFTEKGFKILIENPDRRDGLSTYVGGNSADGAVLDLCHFDFNDVEDLDLHMRQCNPYAIKEIQFAYHNHELFEAQTLVWLEKRLKVVQKYIDIHDLRFICEGTQKNSKDLDALIDYLKMNFFLLDKMLITKNE